MRAFLRALRIASAALTGFVVGLFVLYLDEEVYVRWLEPARLHGVDGRTSEILVSTVLGLALGFIAMRVLTAGDRSYNGWVVLAYTAGALCLASWLRGPLLTAQGGSPGLVHYEYWAAVTLTPLVAPFLYWARVRSASGGLSNRRIEPTASGSIDQ